MFSKLIGDVDNISPCILFYTSNDNITDDCLTCRCVLCLQEVRMAIKPSVNAHSLKRHLDDVHGYISTLVYNHYEKDALVRT